MENAEAYLGFDHFYKLGYAGQELGTLEVTNSMLLTQLELSS